MADATPTAPDLRAALERAIHDYGDARSGGTECDAEWLAIENALNAIDAARAALEQPAQVALTVWFGSMPESNGRQNWTVQLYRKGGDFTDGITIERSEYKDRARYEYDRMRFLLGEIDKEPFILDYDADLHSGYAAPEVAGATGAPIPALTDADRVPDDFRNQARGYREGWNTARSIMLAGATGAPTLPAGWSITLRDDAAVLTRTEGNSRWDYTYYDAPSRYDEQQAGTAQFLRALGAPGGAGEPEQPRYRMLQDGERIDADDEALQEDGETWMRVGALFSRCIWRKGGLLLPVRRRLVAAEGDAGEQSNG
jgi:hypothetical protein